MSEIYKMAHAIHITSVMRENSLFELAEIREMLEELEWSGVLMEMRACPVCWESEFLNTKTIKYEKPPHAPDCRLASLIQKLKAK